MWGLPSLELPSTIGAQALPDLDTRLRFIAALLRGVGPPAPGSEVERILASLFALLRLQV